MRYFFDTEFDEDGRTIELISIGVVAEDGREFYRVSTEFNPRHCNPWVKANVLPQLPPRDSDLTTGVWASRSRIAAELHDFVRAGRTDPYDRPEFWAYYADYDWVALCQLYGPMVALPDNWPMYCRDLKQWCDELGNPQLAPQDNEHDALADARWNSQVWAFLERYQAEQVWAFLERYQAEQA